jgi:hypothetical protein
MHTNSAASIGKKKRRQQQHHSIKKRGPYFSTASLDHELAGKVRRR